MQATAGPRARQRERLSAEEIADSRYVYDPLGRRVGKQVWQSTRYGEGYNARWVRPWKAEVTWYGRDGDRLVITQTEASRVQTIYSPGSFTPLVRVETPVAALEAAGRHRTLAEKLQEDGSEDGGGVTFPPELVQMLDRLEGELRTDSVSEASRTWLGQCGLTEAQMRAQLEAIPAVKRTIHLYHCDHRGLPLALVNAEGTTVWRGEYDEWGNQLNEVNLDNLQQLIRLAGQQHDRESGLYYNRYRYYNPRQGRYITQDPIGLKGGWNPYLYPLNPIRFIDPLGLEQVCSGLSKVREVLGQMA